jgi:dethiobiotin synthetase
LLTAQAIAHSGLKLVGWVGNSIEPAFERSSDNVRALEERLNAPLLGVIPHRASPDAAAALQFLDLEALD